MAAFLEMKRSADRILVELEHLSKEAEYAREEENRSALVIQSMWRGYRVRSHFKFLHRCATTLQTWWRIYKAKVLYRQKLKERVVQMRLKFYDENAVMIQKVWRGFYVRKYVLNFYSRKKYFAGLEQKNEQIRLRSQQYRDYLDQRQAEQQRHANIAKLEAEAKRTHHLVSTKTIPGIYNSRYLEAPKEMEVILKETKFEVTKSKKPTKPSKEEEIAPIAKFLPPLKAKPQGPFRQPEDVRYQRYRPLKPSLRCETDYFAVEKMREEIKAQEWVERIHDETFKTSINHDKPYTKMLLTEESFVEPLELQRISLRATNKNQWIERKDFRSLVHGVPEFDKFETTYVEPHYYYSSS